MKTPAARALYSAVNKHLKCFQHLLRIIDFSANSGWSSRTLLVSTPLSLKLRTCTDAIFDMQSIFQLRWVLLKLNHNLMQKAVARIIQYDFVLDRVADPLYLLPSQNHVSHTITFVDGSSCSGSREVYVTFFTGSCYSKYYRIDPSQTSPRAPQLAYEHGNETSDYTDGCSRKSRMTDFISI